MQIDIIVSNYFIEGYIGDMPNQNLDFVKAKIKDATLTSFRNYNANLPRRLSNDEVAKFF